MNITKKDIATAAQLWCLPQHSKKQMDPDFAISIAKALAKERQGAMKKFNAKVDK